MASLVELLKDAPTLKDAFNKMKGRIMLVDSLPWPARFEVLDNKTDYFIGMWLGNTAKKEFMAPYGDLRSVFSFSEEDSKK